MISFTISAILLVSVSSLVARHFGQTTGERFLIALAATALQIGAISSGLSVFYQLRPAPWLAAQSFLFVITLAATIINTHRHSGSLKASIPKASAEESEEAEVSASNEPLDPVTLIVLLLVIGFVTASGLTQLLTPVSGFDERMYHASRVLYWIQQQSVFPYVSHNDRQVVYSFGSELWFLWPVLLTRTEVIGRMIFWLGFPAAVMALDHLLHELKVNRLFRSIGLLLFVATPIVQTVSVGLKPEIWLAAMMIGAAFWIVRALQQPESAPRCFFFSALFLALSINIKFTALAMLPVLFLIPWLTKSRPRRLPAFRAMFMGGIAGLLLSGLLITVAFNLHRDGNLMGPQALNRVTSSDRTPIQLYTHAVRLPFLLMEFPLMPGNRLRNSLTRAGNQMIARLGADQPLALETNEGWPGRFAYSVPENAEKFSLGGLLWLPFLLVGLTLVMLEAVRTFPAICLSPLSVLVLLQAFPFFGIVFLVRWMTDSGLPERFLISVYPLGIAIMVVLLARFLAQRVFLAAGFAVLIAVMLAGSARLELWQLRTALSPGFTWALPGVADQVFASALQHIPPGSVILLAGHQNAPDYALFAPQDQYPNRVVSWGKAEFDSARMRQLINDHRITHVLIQDDHELSFHWDPPISTSAMIQWLANQRDLNEVPLAAGRMRLFKVAGREKY